MNKNFCKEITYNAMYQAVKARNELLYAQQLIQEIYNMRDDYQMPDNTYPYLRKANETCTKEGIPALNEIVANMASAYIRCHEKTNETEQPAKPNKTSKKRTVKEE